MAYSERSSFKYRPDIDGLRAIAVILVVTFHAFPEIAPGGFIGVDIFFVISGYLISKIILEGLQAGNFSFSNFYERRIKRIFPALIIVLLCCYLFGWFSLLAVEYKQLAKHLIGGTVFVSNILNWSESGYFDNSAETKPLLHLWSLGIEEQFYLLWPVVLWIFHRKKISLWWPICSLTITSFYLNIRIAHQNPTAVFFSPQTRFWELITGSFLAIWEINSTSWAWTKNRFYKLVCVFFPWFGLSLLIYGLLNISKNVHFPGKWGIVPVLGAALIIAGGPSGWVNKVVLSRTLLVKIGIWSFPLYLWHWPLLSFALIIEDGNPSTTLRLGLVGASVFLAWMTYSLIEVPIRFGRMKLLTWKAITIPLIILGVFGAITYIEDGLPRRKYANLHNFVGDIGHLDFHRYISKKYHPCVPESLHNEALQWEGFTRCAQSVPNSPIDIAIIGDSHAEHLFIGLAEQARHKNVAFYIKNGAPLLSNASFKNIFNFVLENKNVKDVVLTMAWTRRLHELPVDSNLEKELDKTISIFQQKGKRIYLTDDVPSFPFSAKRCKGKTWLSSKQPICEIKNEIGAAEQDTERALKRIAMRKPSVKLIETKKYFCRGSQCKMTEGNRILFRDEHHLNIEGSLFLGRKLALEYSDELTNLL